MPNEGVDGSDRLDGRDKFDGSDKMEAKTDFFNVVNHAARLFKNRS
jgi:hypothetical protein